MQSAGDLQHSSLHSYAVTCQVLIERRRRVRVPASIIRRVLIFCLHIPSSSSVLFCFLSVPVCPSSFTVEFRKCSTILSCMSYFGLKNKKDTQCSKTVLVKKLETWWWKSQFFSCLSVTVLLGSEWTSLQKFNTSLTHWSVSVRKVFQSCFCLSSRSGLTKSQAQLADCTGWRDISNSTGHHPVEQYLIDSDQAQKVTPPSLQPTTTRTVPIKGPVV